MQHKHNKSLMRHAQARREREQAAESQAEPPAWLQGRVFAGLVVVLAVLAWSLQVRCGAGAAGSATLHACTDIIHANGVACDTGAHRRTAYRVH